ncbi:sodium ion-translocating decarboxylase subunit beta [Desulfuribacillus alkaliarsenatis]|uniref:Glutaconyl-CoA decarboxylase subunit beta n=1 Tax=Desulfuribacillus alkaliarsenatis TaxID=766136 RepID=A0A1E5FZZ4_9FIRM|nr:sodium ion-translocating decarboxylase subunit beta [Desulfuribacillus alkaliarsenatis]OEF96100.1 glutaconyl-CoA decarboxylase subunit beta [Desulfuribacillus alkaliarsenatis]
MDITGLYTLYTNSGIPQITLGSIVMIIICLVLIYLAIVKKYEPLLLLPIAFGALLVNIPGGQYLMEPGGLLHFFYQGIALVIFPPLIFLGIGAMIDFGPMLANPKTILLGAAAQFGIMGAFVFAMLLGFNEQEASSIAIIGGADGPTAIFLTALLAPEMLGAIAIAAYSYMALVPIIQPPIMKLLTTKKERQIQMIQLKPVSKRTKIIFPIMVTIVVGILLPATLPLLGMLMLGNLMRESGVVDRLTETAQNSLINIVTIFLGLSVGATASAKHFLTVDTLSIIALGLVAFSLGTASGVIFGKIMCWWTKGEINPLIGAAGVSAVPMAARVVQVVGQKENPQNFLLMHAMGPNVAGVIGSAVAAGILLALYG